MNTLINSLLSVRAMLLIVPFVLCFESAHAANEVGPNYFIFKEVHNNQTDVGTVAPSMNPDRFGTFVQEAQTGSVTSGTVSLPAGSSATNPQSLSPDNPSADYTFQAKFPDQTSLNSNYADGTYVINLTGASSANYSASMSLTGGVYPSAAPLVTNTTWSNGSLVVDPSSSFTLNWSPFTGSTGSDKIVLTLQETTTFSQLFVLPSSATSLTLAAGTFQPNASLSADITFLKVTSTDTTDISGSTGYAGYGDSTSITIQTVPEPTTYALLSLGGSLGIAAAYQKRRQKA